MSQPSSPAQETYVNPGSVIGTAITFIALGVAVVIGRFSIRRVKHSSIGADDWFALAALIQYILNLTFVLVIGSIRISILLFYRRIFLGRSFTVAWWIVIITTTLWTAIFFFTSVFQCGTNFSAFWGSFADNAKHCIYIFGEVVALAVTDVSLDVVVLCLPLPYVWKLQMPKRQKLAISFVFLLGLFSVAAGATRMAMNIDVNFLHRIVGFTLFWQLVQVGVALIASNLLTLRPIFITLWPDGLLSRIRIQLSSQGSGSRTRHTKEDKTSEDYAYLNRSVQGFQRMGDLDQSSTAIPLHTLTEKDNKLQTKVDQLSA